VKACVQLDIDKMLHSKRASHSSHLLTDEALRTGNKNALVLLFLLFLTCLLLYDNKHHSLESSTGMPHWHFWNLIRLSEFYRTKCSGNQCRRKYQGPSFDNRHPCGDIHVFISQVASQLPIHNIRGFSHTRDPEFFPNVPWTTTSAEFPMHKLIDSFLVYFKETILRFAGKSILFTISIDPDHAFALECDPSGDFRLYQSWVNSFDVAYWTGVEKKICEQDPAAIRSIRVAREKFGKLNSIDLVDALRLVTVVSEMLGVYIDPYTPDMPIIPKAASTIEFLGKEVLTIDKLAYSPSKFPVRIICAYVVFDPLQIPPPDTPFIGNPIFREDF